MQTEALARHIGVSRTTLYRWTRSGLVPPATRQGRTALFSPAAIAVARNLAESAR